jgi:hypothetical protein
MQARSCQDARYFSSPIEDMKNRTALFASKQLRVAPESIVLVSVRREEKRREENVFLRCVGILDGLYNISWV